MIHGSTNYLNKVNDPKYSYAPRRNMWAVYEMEYTGSGSSGIKLEEYPTKEQARKRCYELNGWKYKEPIQKV